MSKKKKKGEKRQEKKAGKKGKIMLATHGGTEDMREQCESGVHRPRTAARAAPPKLSAPLVLIQTKKQKNRTVS